MRSFPPRFRSAVIVTSVVVALCGPAAFAARSSDDNRTGDPDSARIVPPADLGELLAECDRLVASDQLLEARQRLALALRVSGLDEEQRSELRRRLEAINQITFFSPRLVPGDPFTDRYIVAPGDTLARIASRLELGVDWRLLQRINGLPAPGHVRAFQAIKVVWGPFHARVSRRDFRLDVYAGDPEHADRWLYVRSFPVGLGEESTTPLGAFVVRAGGKVANPFWIDPRTGTWYGPGASDNPIGDRWIGLEGLGDSASLTGYGLHGTVEPTSIGEARSMGCVRLLPADVHLLFELLTEGVSRIVIED